MPEVTRVTRSSYTGRDRDDYSSDDERSTYSRTRHGGGGDSYRTVQRYRVTPARDDDFSDRHSRVEVLPTRGERIEIDRRSERYVDPERPRSAVEPRPRSSVVEHERYVERDTFREPDRSRTVVYERDSPRDYDNRRPWERSNRPWESDREIRETDVRIEKRTTERRDEPYELERYQRETEYYDRPDPPPQPIVIRQRAPEPQQIIVQEAPSAPPIIIPRAEQSYDIVRREESQQVVVPESRRQREDEYYYRRDVREVGSRRDEDFEVARYDRRGRSEGGWSEDEDYVVKRRIIRERSSSADHKRHLAEGALAGAGAAALLAHHKSKQGSPVDHPKRNVVGGAALGAIGAEVITRARSRYRDSRADRSRSRSSSHSRVKTGLGIAAAAVVAAAAVKLVRDRKANKEELGRGRSRSRRRRRSSAGSYYSDSSHEIRTVSTHRDPKHRAASIAKAGAATAVVAGVVDHIRSRSRKRDGSRSRSRIRQGAKIVGSGLAGAAVAGLYENRKAKKEERADEAHDGRQRRRSRSRARSLGAYSDRGVDPELGMVQYGTDPVYQETTTTGGSRRRSRQRRDSSSDSHRSRSRSRSRVRNIAGAAAGTAAAAIGVNQYQKRKAKKERERERERRRYEEDSPEDYYERSYDDGYSPSPPHASGGSFYPAQPVFPPPPQEAPAPGFTQHINISTPHVAMPPIPPYNPQDYPPPPTNHGYPPTATRGAGNNVSTHEHPSTLLSGGGRASREPLHHENANIAVPTAIPYFPPPPTSPFPETRAGPRDHAEAHRLSPVLSPTPDIEGPHNRSVMFAPLSPTSSRRLEKIHKDAENNPDTIHTAFKSHAHHESHQLPIRTRSQDPATEEALNDPDCQPGHKRRRRTRRNSDPSSDRPFQSPKHRRRREPQTSHTRDASPASSASSSPNSDVEILPDRFDADGRPLDRHGNLFRGSGSGSGTRGGDRQTEMVEKIVRDVGEVVDGRKTWKDLLMAVVTDASAAAGGSGAGAGARGGGNVDSGSDDARPQQRRRR